VAIVRLLSSLAKQRWQVIVRQNRERGKRDEPLSFAPVLSPVFGINTLKMKRKSFREENWLQLAEETCH
jgi:hypothetical protein